jgi:hypothetical protein
MGNTCKSAKTDPTIEIIAPLSVPIAARTDPTIGTISQLPIPIAPKKSFEGSDSSLTATKLSQSADDSTLNGRSDEV